MKISAPPAYPLPVKFARGAAATAARLFRTPLSEYMAHTGMELESINFLQPPCPAKGSNRPPPFGSAFSLWFRRTIFLGSGAPFFPLRERGVGRKAAPEGAPRPTVLFLVARKRVAF